MITIKIESVMTPTPMYKRYRSHKRIHEDIDIDGFEIGTRYSDFDVLDNFIDEYDIDPTTLKKGDIIIKDNQSGHQGEYIPMQVTKAYDGKNIYVTQDTETNKEISVCVEPDITRGTIYHKLDKNKLIKDKE